MVITFFCFWASPSLVIQTREWQALHGFGLFETHLR